MSFQKQQNLQYCCGVQDAARFLLLSLTVNMIIYISFLPDIVKFQLGSTAALLQLLGTVLNALPPLLASVLVILRAVTVMRLRRQSVFVSDTQKLHTAAQLDLVLFDKTGTLTMGEVRAWGWLCIHCHSHKSTAQHPLCPTGSMQRHQTCRQVSACFYTCMCSCRHLSAGLMEGNTCLHVFTHACVHADTCLQV